MNCKLIFICFFICYSKIIFAQDLNKINSVHINLLGGTITNINDYYLSKKAGWISFSVDKQVSPKFYFGVKTQIIRYFELGDLITESYEILNQETDLEAFLKISTKKNKHFMFSGNLGVGIVKSEYTDLTNNLIPVSSRYIRETQIVVDPFVEIKKSLTKNFQIVAVGGIKLYPQNPFDNLITSTMMGDVNWIPYYGIGLTFKFN